MTGAERTRILDLAMDEKNGVNLQMVYPEIVISTAFDPTTGEQIFSPADRAALLSKSASALDTLATVGMRLSGFTQETSDDLGKDSSVMATGDSSSNQPNGWAGLSMSYSTAVLLTIQFPQSNQPNGKPQSTSGLGKQNKRLNERGDVCLTLISKDE